MSRNRSGSLNISTPRGTTPRDGQKILEKLAEVVKAFRANPSLNMRIEIVGLIAQIFELNNDATMQFRDGMQEALAKNTFSIEELQELIHLLTKDKEVTQLFAERFSNISALLIGQLIALLEETTLAYQLMTELNSTPIRISNTLTLLGQMIDRENKLKWGAMTGLQKISGASADDVLSFFKEHFLLSNIFDQVLIPTGEFKHTNSSPRIAVRHESPRSRADSPTMRVKKSVIGSPIDPTESPKPVLFRKFSVTSSPRLSIKDSTIEIPEPSTTNSSDISVKKSEPTSPSIRRASIVPTLDIAQVEKMSAPSKPVNAEVLDESGSLWKDWSWESGQTPSSSTSTDRTPTPDSEGKRPNPLSVSANIQMMASDFLKKENRLNTLSSNSSEPQLPSLPEETESTQNMNNPLSRTHSRNPSSGSSLFRPQLKKDKSSINLSTTTGINLSIYKSTSGEKPKTDDKDVEHRKSINKTNKH